MSNSAHPNPNDANVGPDLQAEAVVANGDEAHHQAAAGGQAAQVEAPGGQAGVDDAAVAPFDAGDWAAPAQLQQQQPQQPQLQQQQLQPFQPNLVGSVLCPPLVFVAGLQQYAGGAPSLAVKVYSGVNAAANAASGTGQPIFCVSSHTNGVVGFGGWATDFGQGQPEDYESENDDDDSDDDDSESGVDVNDSTDDNNMGDDDDEDDAAAGGIAAAAAVDNDVIFIEEIITVE